MKATITYECELDEIPETISELLTNLQDGSIKDIDSLVVSAIQEAKASQISCLGSIDKIRHLLAKIDKRLMDYTLILAGYMKAQADLKAGITPQQFEEQILKNEKDKNEKTESND